MQDNKFSQTVKGISEPFVYIQEGVSNCCGAPVYDDSDICTACKEHCGVMISCPECDGTGEREVIDTETKNRVRDWTETPSSIIVPCPECNGEGEIEVGI